MKGKTKQAMDSKSCQTRRQSTQIDDSFCVHDRGAVGPRKSKQSWGKAPEDKDFGITLLIVDQEVAAEMIAGTGFGSDPAIPRPWSFLGWKGGRAYTRFESKVKYQKT
jgi:hypothetical protein